MRFDIAEYDEVIRRFHGKMTANGDIAGFKAGEGKWTLKEMVGHLLDSASNNHQRFIRLQLAEVLSFPSYEAEEWRRTSNIGELDYEFLVHFWMQFNFFLLHIIEQIDERHYQNYWLVGDQAQSLQFLVTDYFRHMRWHEELFEERVGEIRKRICA